MPRTLVCVADAQLFLLLRHILVNEGFDALLATQPAEIASICEAEPVAAAIIDWSEGPLDRSGLLASIKAIAPMAAVVALMRDEEGRDAVPSACELVLSRPFNPAILLGFLRRLGDRHVGAAHADAQGTVLRFADLEMNLATVKVHRAGKEVALTALQFRLLRRLLQQPTVVCQRDELIESCWPENVEVEPRTVDIHIGHVRRAMETTGPDLIRTVRGCGYALHLPIE
jgi:two-component system phosphate regulon response regulator PhoB